MSQSSQKGLIFFCNNETQDECIQKCLFGLPQSQANLVQNVKKGDLVLLFNTSIKVLYGPFQAQMPGGLYDETAWTNGDAFTKFSAQVQVWPLWNKVMALQLSHCSFLQLDRHQKFSPIITGNQISSLFDELENGTDATWELFQVPCVEALLAPDIIDDPDMEPTSEQNCQYQYGDMDVDDIPEVVMVDVVETRSPTPPQRGLYIDITSVTDTSTPGSQPEHSEVEDGEIEFERNGRQVVPATVYRGVLNSYGKNRGSVDKQQATKGNDQGRGASNARGAQKNSAKKPAQSVIGLKKVGQDVGVNKGDHVKRTRACGGLTQSVQQLAVPKGRNAAIYKSKALNAELMSFSNKHSDMRDPARRLKCNPRPVSLFIANRKLHGTQAQPQMQTQEAVSQGKDSMCQPLTSQPTNSANLLGQSANHQQHAAPVASAMDNQHMQHLPCTNVAPSQPVQQNSEPPPPPTSPPPPHVQPVLSEAKVSKSGLVAAQSVKDKDPAFYRECEQEFFADNDEFQY